MVDPASICKKLPETVLQHIIPYTYRPQLNELRADIVSYVETMSVIDAFCIDKKFTSRYTLFFFMVKLFCHVMELADYSFIFLPGKLICLSDNQRESVVVDNSTNIQRLIRLKIGQLSPEKRKQINITNVALLPR